MVWYEKKKDILARLGKGEKDVRYLERMIRIGKVVKRWSEYALREEEGEDWEIQLKEELEKVKEELRQYKEAINGYREKIDRLESEKADLKVIYGNKLWKFLQNRFHLVDEEYDEMMKFLDS